MAPVTRRRLLHGTAALFAALAGCNESDVRETSSEPRRPENVERDPDAHVLRTPTDHAAAWLRREDDGTASTDAADAETPPDDAHRHGLVASAETAARLRFAEVDGVEDARRFVEGIDFDRETLYFETRSVRECYELELCYVTWSAQDVGTTYGSYYRDADVDCRRDAEETTTWFIRIPDTLDPERVTGRGSGWSSDGCRYPPYLRTTAEDTTTDEVVAHPVTTNATDATSEDER